MPALFSVLPAFLVVVVALVPAAPGFASTASEPPGLEHEGESGLLLEPYVFADGQPVRPLDPEDFTVRMVGADDPEHGVLEFPAGKVFRPPPGRFRVWLEGPGWMTPFTDLLIVRGGGPEGRRTRKMPVVPSGTVLPPAGFKPSDEVRLLYAGGDPLFGAIRLELTRRAAIGKWPEEGVRMPQGPVVAAVWRPEAQQYLAISRPFDVDAGQRLTPSFSAPKPGSGHLIAYVERGSRSKASEVEGLNLWLDYPAQAIGPDLTVVTGWGAYAVWYDLPPGSPDLVGESDRLTCPETKVSIEAGGVVRAGATLVQRSLEP